LVSLSDLDRFWAKVKFNPTTGCWDWTASLRKGYGQFRSGDMHPSHRWIIEVIHDVKYPQQVFIMHRCNRPTCVNPSHLVPGTNSVNQDYSVASGRHWQTRKTECPQGHGYTEENTYVDKQGKRHCRTCNRIRQQGES